MMGLFNRKVGNCQENQATPKSTKDSATNALIIGTVSDRVAQSQVQARIRISEARLNKLRRYAQKENKTMTKVVGDWIDSLEV